MTTQPEPRPEERNAPPERHVEEEAMRGAGFERPDELREDVGLDEERDAEPEGAPQPTEDEE